MSIEAMKQALEALDIAVGDGAHDYQKYLDAITSLRTAIEQAEKQEPRCAVIVEVFGKDWRLDYMSLPVGKHKLYTQEYVYTTPQPQQAEKQEPVALVANGVLVKSEFPENYTGYLYTTPQPQEFVCSTGLCHYTQPQQLEKQEPIREMLINAATLAVASERKGKYQGASWVADAILENTHPQPKRAWSELTKDEIKQLNLTAATNSDVQDIQAKLKEKNT